MFINIISITRTPTGILNAGSDGRPKQLPWGDSEGDWRQYVSAQAQKAWLRQSTAFQAIGDGLSVCQTVRTARITPQIAHRHIALGMAEKDAQPWADAARALFVKAEGGKNAPVALGAIELDAISQAAFELARAGEKPPALAERLKKSPLLDPKASGLSAAIFGRMATADAVVTVRSAVHVGPAIACRTYAPIDDFFSATDDFPEKGIGAGYIGDRELAPPALFLRTVVIDLDQLAENLGLEIEEAAAVAGGLVEAVLRSFTLSGVTSTGSYARTVEARAEVLDRQPTTCIEAVRTPCDDPAEVWTRIVANRSAEYADYGRPKAVVDLAECRGLDGPALTLMAAEVRRAIVESADTPIPEAVQ